MNDKSKTTEPYPGYTRWHGHPAWKWKMPWRLARSLRIRLFAEATNWGRSNVR